VCVYVEGKGGVRRGGGKRKEEPAVAAEGNQTETGVILLDSGK